MKKRTTALSIGIFLMMCGLGFAGAFGPTAEQLSFPGQRLENPDGGNENYYRKVFEVPNEPVFRAVVNVSYQAELFINGEKVPDTHRHINTGGTMYWTGGMDITRYIKPGKNVIGLYSRRIGHGHYAYFDGRVISASGAATNIQDGVWKTASAPVPADWHKPDFDDSSWKEAKKTQAQTCYNEKNRASIYSGPLVIENPGQQKLFYSAGKDIAFRITFPAGLIKEGARLAYKIQEVPGGKETQQAEISSFLTNAIRAECLLNAGRLNKGVYVLSLHLEGNGQVIAQRTNEPFIVAGKIVQKEVSGANLYESLGLTLCDTVNCADAGDKHPFLEGGAGKSRIISRGKSDGPAAYREAGGSHGKETSFLAYQVKFETTDEPYLIVFEYPDDKDRYMGFSINTLPEDPKSDFSLNNPHGYMQEGGGAITGGRFPLSGKAKQYNLLYFPYKQEAMLFITTLAKNMPAAISRISIYKVADMPALQIKQSNERFIGFHSERGYSFRKLLSGVSGKGGFVKDPYAICWDQYWNPEIFALWFKTVERLAQYLRFSGQNLHVIGCFQYDNRNTPYAYPAFIGDSRLEPDFREIVAAVFSENDLALIGSIELVQIYGMLRNKDNTFVENSTPFPTPTDEEMRQGAETAWCVSKEGAQHIGWGGPISSIPNIFHPLVQAHILRIVDDICEKLAVFPSFKGLYSVDLPGVFGFVPSYVGNPVLYGYEDFTIELFEKETGVSIPVDRKDQERFSKRYEWIRANAKEAWLNWRCQKVLEVRKLVLDRMQKHRQDLKLICAYHDWRSKPEKFRLAGLDLNLYRDVPGLSIARYGLVGGGFGMQAHLAGMRALENPALIAAFERPLDRTVCIKNIFDETGITNPQYDDAWPWKSMLTGGLAMPAAHHTGWQFAAAEIGSDPDTIVFGWGDDAFMPGHEQVIADFAKGFLPLPREKLAVISGEKIDPNVTVRAGIIKEKYFIALINPGWWSSKVELKLADVEKNATVLDLATGAPLKAGVSKGKCVRLLYSYFRQLLVKTGFSKGRRVLKITLPPYGMRGFMVNSARARVEEVKVSTDDSAEKGLTELIERMEQAVLGRGEEEVSREDIALVSQAVQQAKEALKSGKYLECWKLLTTEEVEKVYWKTKTLQLSRPYLVIGPFANNEDFLKKEDEEIAGGASADIIDKYCKGFSTEFAVEKETLANGAPLMNKPYPGIGNQSIKWSIQHPAVQGGERFYLDFLPLFTPKNWTVGYAYTRVYSNEEQKCLLVTGSDDGIKVWLNGNLEISVLKGRGATWGEDRKEVILRKGENTVLVKVENRRGGFGFYLDFVDKDLQPLVNLKYSPLGKEKR